MVSTINNVGITTSTMFMLPPVTGTSDTATNIV